MEDSDTVAVARNFLRLVEEGPVPTERQLLKALDELAVAYHQTPAGDPDDGDSIPPERDWKAYKERHERLGKRFPDCGYYAVSNPTGALNELAMVGDAIDDLADISADLDQVLWRFENVGADDAHWHFRFLFEMHWGMHLRELSLYLHARALRSSEDDGDPER